MPKMVVSVVMGGAMIFMGAATTDAADPIPAKLPAAVGPRPGTSVRSCGLACEQFVLLRGYGGPLRSVLFATSVRSLLRVC
jgi:hypothetical protein